MFRERIRRTISGWLVSPALGAIVVAIGSSFRAVTTRTPVSFGLPIVIVMAFLLAGFSS